MTGGWGGSTGACLEAKILAPARHLRTGHRGA